MKDYRTRRRQAQVSAAEICAFLRETKRNLARDYPETKMPVSLDEAINRAVALNMLLAPLLKELDRTFVPKTLPGQQTLPLDPPKPSG